MCFIPWILKTHSALQTERLCVSSERHRGQQVRFFLPVVHLGQQAVTVDPDLRLLHGRRHCFLNLRVAKAEDASLRWRENQMDPTPLDAETQQCLNGGINIDAVPVDDGIICTEETSWVGFLFRCKPVPVQLNSPK